MNQISQQQIIEALTKVRYPGSGKNLIEEKMVSQDDITLSDSGEVAIRVRFAKSQDPFAKSVVKAVETAIKTYVSDAIQIEGRVEAVFAEAPMPKEDRPLSTVKNIVAVFSGKGGVGKSTITSNLAVALAQKGYRVGLLDADIYGPSMPKMFGCEDARPMMVRTEQGEEKIAPVEVAYGIKLLSIGFFVAPDQALMWRGSMACNALTQLMRDGDWGELDFLLLDMPPGTGDIHLSLVQTVAVTGAIVVTTPQEVALVDARKGINMFVSESVNIPVLGLVENMSWFTPRELPENKYYIFGEGGGVRLAEELSIPLLGQIPLVQSVSEAGDAGRPVAANADTLLSEYFSALGNEVVQRIEERNRIQPPTRKVEVTRR